MTRLSERRTRLVFTTANEVKSRGKYRCVVIEARPDYALVRLQGMRTSFPIAYDAIYHAAAKIAAARERAEKFAMRQSKTRFS